MNSEYILIDDSSQLSDFLEQKNKNIEIILTSRDFSNKDLSLLEKNKYIWFDEIMTYEHSNEITHEVEHFINNWYLTEDRIDLSLINNLSLGKAFTPSVTILINAIYKCYVGLSLILKDAKIVYLYENTDIISKATLCNMSIEMKFQLKSIKNKKNNVKNKFGKHKIEIDATGRYRDLSSLYLSKGYIYYLSNNLLFWLLKYINNKRNNSKTVMLESAGKLEDLFNYISTTDGDLSKISWLLPTKKIKDIFKSQRNSGYFISKAIMQRPTVEIDLQITLMKDNLNKKKYIVPSSVINQIFNDKIYVYFTKAYFHYLSSIETLKAFNPSLVILPTENHEKFLITAMAAKRINVKTALLTHGYNYWINQNLINKGKHTLFKYILSHGRVDEKNFSLAGVNRKLIIDTGFPYYQAMLPKKNYINKLNSALILTPDFTNIDTNEKSVYNFEYYKSILEILDNQKIECYGIKSRHNLQFSNHCTDYIQIGSRVIRLFSGYINLREILEKVDMVIGYPGTALIETYLMGKVFYPIHLKYKQNKNLYLKFGISDFMYIANDYKELGDNISNKRQFKRGHSIYDFIGINKYFESNIDLRRKFCTQVENLVIRNVQ